MRTVTFPVYTYDELAPDAQAKARRWWTSLPESVWLDLALEDCKAQLTKLGLDIESTAYSIGYSQGDYAGFVGTYDYPETAPVFEAPYEELGDIAQKLAEMNKETSEPLHARIRVSNFGNPIVDNDNHDELPLVFQRLARWLYRHLRAEVDYQLSDDYVAETLRASTYEFTAPGKRWGGLA